MSTLYKGKVRTSLAVQWLRLHASNVGGTGLTPDQGTKILHASEAKKNKKRKDQFMNPGGLLFWLECSYLLCLVGKKKI